MGQIYQSRNFYQVARRLTVTLYDTHIKDLQASGLSDSTIETMEVYSLKPGLVMGLPDTIIMRTESALIFPYFDHKGQKTSFIRAKLFPPYKGKNGITKYWQPPKTSPHLYVLPAIDEALENSAQTLYIVEGEKKTAKAVEDGFVTIGLGGLWNWKEKAAGLIKEFELINWAGRETIIVPDSDVWELKSHSSRMAVYLLGKELEEHGANVQIRKIIP